MKTKKKIPEWSRSILGMFYCIYLRNSSPSPLPKPNPVKLPPCHLAPSPLTLTNFIRHRNYIYNCTSKFDFVAMEDSADFLRWLRSFASFHTCIVYNFKFGSCGWVRTFSVIVMTSNRSHCSCRVAGNKEWNHFLWYYVMGDIRLHLVYLFS